MQYLIKEWPNKMATLMTEDGVVLWTFSNVKEAEKVWKDWCSLKNQNNQNANAAFDLLLIDWQFGYFVGISRKNHNRDPAVSFLPSIVSFDSIGLFSP